MGWSSGSGLMSDIIFGLKKVEKDAARREAIYGVLIPAFEDQDCDTLYECEREDKAFKAALKKHGGE
jgi:hypothetical protein